MGCRMLVVPVPIEHVQANWGKLVGTAGLDPICDSFNAICLWSTGVSLLFLRQFLPCASRSPGRVFSHKWWTLTVERGQDLQTTMRAAGIVLDGCTVVSVVLGSMAAEA